MKPFKNKIFKYAILLGIVATTPIALQSCRQELDVNVDPNNPANASIQGLLTGAQVGAGYYLGGEATRMPASIIQHYAGHRAQPNQYAIYDITSPDTDGIWEYLYNVLRDLKELENKASASGDQVYVGVSKILQAHLFSVGTDLFGDMPFTEALKDRNNITPKYDKQEDIYPALVKMLEEGTTLVKSGTGKIPAGDDLIYNGDVNKWEKFANSLKLRLLNHQSKINPGLAASYLATNPSLIDDFADNAKVTFRTEATNSNPIYQFDNLSGRKDMAVSTTIVDKMKSLSDPRVSVYFLGVKNGANAGQIIGNAPGNDTDDAGEMLYSRVGSAYASANSPVVFMSAAEVNFIKAEIYQRAGNSASAKTAYEEAIRQDLSALGLGSSSATYLANAGVAYDNTLQRIIEQKWITMYQAPYEAWVDWRRTGFPTLAPALYSESTTDKVIPRRLPYPSSEINTNGANLAAGPGVPIDYQTMKTKMWWDQ